MANVTYKEIDTKLDNIAESIAEIKQCVAMNKATLEMLSRLVDRHERILFGDDGRGGLIQDVNNISRAQSTAQKALWVIITPMLVAIGGGIVYLIAGGVL